MILNWRIWASSSFLRHYDEAQILLKSQPQICAIAADGGHSLILVNRSFSASLITAFRGHNPSLGWILLGVSAILAASLLWPWLSALFAFGALHLDDLAVTLAAGIIVLLVLEAIKPLWRKSLRS
ncbi:cation transporting ATPase C-terminal domain-containing protein [Aminobacter sp. MSH1]|uniref:cation transporting ATPase C-terminal domain-containing protein n=1 Tax=Aminobacter sp. MSH1 TaxID=374606 RepID=UPI0031B8AA48